MSYEFNWTLDKAQIIEVFIEEDSTTQSILKQAIKYCKKQQATLVVAPIGKVCHLVANTLVFSTPTQKLITPMNNQLL